MAGKCQLVHSALSAPIFKMANALKLCVAKKIVKFINVFCLVLVLSGIFRTQLLFYFQLESFLKRKEPEEQKLKEEIEEKIQV